MLESTRDTITIHHGENGTAEKTTVDTNPQKVLEHVNLISDSEYITLNHQQGKNTTHIQTAALKQQLDALQGGLQELFQTISAIGGGGTTSLTYYPARTGGVDFHYSAFKQVVTQAERIFVTYTFDCDPTFGERVLTGELKSDLEKFVQAGMTVSNGAISITNDGTTMKLIKSGSSQNVNQQGTFTFYDGTINV